MRPRSRTVLLTGAAAVLCFMLRPGPGPGARAEETRKKPAAPAAKEPSAPTAKAPPSPKVKECCGFPIGDANSDTYRHDDEVAKGDLV